MKRQESGPRTAASPGRGSLFAGRHALDNVDWSDEFSYVREMYGVPARKDMRVVMDGHEGRIVAGDGARLLILREGDDQPVSVHPCWRMHYIIEADDRV